MSRRMRRWILPLAAGILVSCAAERIGDPGGGSILVRFEVADGGARRTAVAALPDSVRVEVRKESERIAAAAAAVGDSGRVAIDLACRPGRGFELHMAADGPHGGERGTIYHGSASGIDVERGRTTEVSLLLRRSAPEAPAVEGSPGDLSYAVRWARVLDASGYLLRERSGDETIDYELPDTFRVFQPWEAKGTARLSRRVSGTPAARSPSVEGRRTFQVRSRLPLGWSVFSDTASIVLEDWFDLPLVASVEPADSATGVRDIASIRIRFDRPMQLAGAPDSLVTIRLLPAGDPIACIRQPDGAGTELELNPVDPMPRGAWARIRVSTGLRDLDGRPLDQDRAAEGLQAFVSDFRVEEYAPLQVVSVEPADGSEAVSVGVTIRVRCDRPVLRSSVTAETFVVSDTAGALAGQRSFADQDREILFAPATPLRFDLEHSVRLTPGVLDAEREEPLDSDPESPGLQEFRSEFRTETQPRGARVTETVPAADEPLHPVWVNPEVQFDRPIDPGSIDPSASMSVQVLRGASYFNLGGRWTASADETRFTFVPNRALERDAGHRIVVVGGPSGVLDRGGIPFDQDPRAQGYQSFEALFRTEQNVRVVSVAPVDGAIDVAWDSPVRIRFDKPVQPASIVDTTVVLLQNDQPILSTRVVSSDGREATLTPLSPLQSYREYRLQVTPGVRSLRGGALDQDSLLAGHQGFSSRFTSVPERVPPRVVEVRPPDGETGAPVDGVVQVFFSEPVRPSQVIQYLHVSRDSLGLSNLAGTVTMTPDSLRGTFAPASSFAFKTTYFVHVDAWIYDPLGNRFDQDPDTPGNQAFRSRFSTENEKTPPQVAAVDPVDGSSSAPVEGPVRIDFTESMDRASVAAALEVRSGGAPIAGSVAFADADRRATWTPAAPLRYDRLYSVHVDTTAVDLAGNRLDMELGTPRPDPFESSFRTAPDTVGPRVEAVEPAAGSTGVQVGIVPVIRFSEPIDPATVNAASVTLSDSAGALAAASRTVDASGRAVTIAPDAPLQFETLYRITVYPTLADTSGNGYDDDPGAPGDQPFVSTFRTQNETIPPEVIDLLLRGSPLVSVETDVRAVFSEAIDPASLDESTFRLLLDEAPVPSNITVAASGDTATLVPLSPLEYETRYTVGIAGIRDRRGNIQDEDPSAPGNQGFEAQFDTEEDQVPPRVTRTIPASGAMGVDPSTPLRIVFSEPMDTTSFSVADPGLYREGVPFEAVRTAEEGDSAFTLVPVLPLERGSVYEWRAGPLLTDRNGNATGTEFRASFEVGIRPVANAGAGVCSNGDTAAVAFDASASHDPDGAIARVYWEWGDGTRDTLDAPAGLTPVHLFPCVDDAGCDGLDNDGDGGIDETGDEGCDESYRVRMTVEDGDGFRSTDSTGVSFCAFRARVADPGEGATMVDTLATVSILFYRAVDPASVDSTSIWVEPDGGLPIAAGLTFEQQNRVVRITPDAPLSLDTLYTIRATGEVRSATGSSLDQDPCVSGIQEFQSRFRTIQAGPSRPIDPPSMDRDPSLRR